MRQQSAILGIVLCCALMRPAFGQQGRVYEAETGPFRVETAETVRIGDLVTRVYYPIGPGPFPVIVFSHGLGGNKDAFGIVSRHWASHGYVTVHPTHDDRGVSLGTGGMNPPPEKVMGRVGNVKAVLDGLSGVEDQIPALRAKLDGNRIGIAGHSYGSFIAMLIGGVRGDMGAEKMKSVADARVKCIVPIATAGRGDYGLTEASWKSLSIPALFFNGTRDIRLGRTADWREEPYRFSVGPDKYKVIIKDAMHGSFGVENDPSNAQKYVRVASVAFWDSCLKGLEGGKAYLTLDDGFRKFAGESAVLSMK